jgi:hypothetical protein
MLAAVPHISVICDNSVTTQNVWFFFNASHPVVLQYFISVIFYFRLKTTYNIHSYTKLCGLTSGNMFRLQRNHHQVKVEHSLGT